MEKIVFDCEVITPMFLYGANDSQPELRSPSIKGLMRFWWRAMHGNLRLEELRRQEGQIFGYVDKPAEKSRVGVRILSPNISNRPYWPLPHKKNFQKTAIKEGSSFKIELALRDKINLDLKNFFLLVSILGGFGNRSRRGFGSIQVVKINEGKNEIKVTLDEILRLLTSINSGGSFTQDAGVIKNGSTGTTQYPFIKEIAIGKDYSSVDEILRAIGQASHNHNSDYTGFGGNQGRLASPVYVSVIKDNSNYKPVITTLNTVFPNGHTPTGKFADANNFIKEVLR